MKCHKFQEWISLETDDQLPPDKVRPLQDHLQTCEECRGYREDLQVGLRMLHATDPVLPDNFDWKLQLKLSQTLRETARDAAYPWHAGERGWRRWMTRAGLSAAMGLAAVLAVAVIVPDQLSPRAAGDDQAVAAATRPLRLPVQTVEPQDLGADASRRPLESIDPFWSARGLQRSVSTGFPPAVSGNRTDFADHDLLRIRQLEQEVQVLRRRMQAKDNEINVLQARLDSLIGQAVDNR